MSIGSDGAAIACTGARYTAFHQRIHCLWNMSEAEYSCGMATHCVWWVILVIGYGTSRCLFARYPGCSR